RNLGERKPAILLPIRLDGAVRAERDRHGRARVRWRLKVVQRASSESAQVYGPNLHATVLTRDSRETCAASGLRVLELVQGDAVNQVCGGAEENLQPLQDAEWRHAGAIESTVRLGAVDAPDAETPHRRRR